MSPAGVRRIGPWSPDQAAEELHRRRSELIGQLRRRSEGRGIPLAAQEDIVTDAITEVVMSPRGVVNEQHLWGAFWLAVDFRCRRHREGRGFARLGSRVRVDFEDALGHVCNGDGPYEKLEMRDRFRRAADFMAELDPTERQVISAMATHGVGPVPAARILEMPLGEVRAAMRSAHGKLDRVAVIAAAGRMCAFRYSAIAAEAAGEASEREATVARAHLNACAPCTTVYRELRREMLGPDFQRAAAAAFVPVAPMSALNHGRVLGRVAAWIEQRVAFVPRGSGQQVAGVVGGAGLAKAAVAGSALIAVTASLAVHHGPSHSSGHRSHRANATVGTIAATRTSAVPASSIGTASTNQAPPGGSAGRETAQAKALSGAKRLPRRLRYLALGARHPATPLGAVAKAASTGSQTSTEGSAVTRSASATAGSASGGRFKYLGGRP
jgi:DNA-directed RNA polymerase specialized sigma24 family protein